MCHGQPAVEYTNAATLSSVSLRVRNRELLRHHLRRRPRKCSSAERGDEEVRRRTEKQVHWSVITERSKRQRQQQIHWPAAPLGHSRADVAGSITIGNSNDSLRCGCVPSRSSASIRAQFGNDGMVLWFGVKRNCLEHTWLRN